MWWPIRWVYFKSPLCHNKAFLPEFCMPSSKMLSERVVAAVENEDMVAFKRWSSHPRFSPWLDDNQRAYRVAVHLNNPVPWLDAIKEAGIQRIEGFSLLETCVRVGNVSAAQWLVEDGVPVSGCNEWGTTALGSALRAGEVTHAVPVLQYLWGQKSSLKELLKQRGMETFRQDPPWEWVTGLLEVGWRPWQPDPGEDESFFQELEKDPSASPRLKSFLLECRLERRFSSVEVAPASPRIRL